MKVHMFVGVVMAMIVGLDSPGFTQQADDISQLKLRDWQPRSMLKTKQSQVNKPAFPVIDVHNHLGGGRDRLTPERVKHYLTEMDAAGIDPLWGEGISFGLGYGHLAAHAIVRAFENNDFSFTTYRKQLLEHELGQELMNRLHWADKLYRSSGTEDAKDFLLSLFTPRKNG